MHSIGNAFSKMQSQNRGSKHRLSIFPFKCLNTQTNIQNSVLQFVVKARNTMFNQICAHGGARKSSWLVIRLAAYQMGNKQLQWYASSSGPWSLAYFNVVGTKYDPLSHCIKTFRIWLVQLCHCWTKCIA